MSSHTYKQGHSSSTISSHLLRTAEVEASFLLPHIESHSRILDVGCGPGTITTGFLKYAPQGRITGVDISPSVLAKARDLASAAEPPIPTSGPGSATFEEGNVLDRLPYPDDSFDVVYVGQVFGHIRPDSGEPVRALKEIRRVLKPGGVLGLRDALLQNFFPASSGLDRLWVRNFHKVVLGTRDEGADTTPRMMPVFLKEAGFGGEGKEMRVGGGVSIFQTPEERRWLVGRVKGQLKEGDEFYQSWLNAGIGAEEIKELLDVSEKWVGMENAWLVMTHGEWLAWK